MSNFSKQPEPGKLDIPLTNRAPVRIIEDDWPIVAEAWCGSDADENCIWGWTLSIKVRRHKDYSERPSSKPSEIIYAVRERILSDQLREHVTPLIDELFAELKATAEKGK